MQTDEGSTLEQRYYEVIRKSTRKGSGCGCYQIMVFLFIKLGILSAGFVVYGFTYWQLVPQYVCHNPIT